MTLPGNLEGSNMSDDSSRAGGIGFGSALGLLFIGLKLGEVIDWSWWWVLAPFWIGGLMALICLIIIVALD